MARYKRKYAQGVQAIPPQQPQAPGSGGQDFASILTGGATGFAAGGPIGGAIGVGLGVAKTIINKKAEEKQYQKDLMQFRIDDTAFRNTSIKSQNELPEQLNQAAALGRYATGSGGIEVEKDELIFSKTPTGKYILKADFYDGKTHNQGGEDYQADQGDIIFPGKDRKKVIKAYKAQDYPKLEAMRVSLPKDTTDGTAQPGLDTTDPKNPTPSQIAQQFAFLNNLQGRNPNAPYPSVNDDPFNNLYNSLPYQPEGTPVDNVPFLPNQNAADNESAFEEALRINRESLERTYERDLKPMGEKLSQIKVKPQAHMQLKAMEEGLAAGKPGITQEMIDNFKMYNGIGSTKRLLGIIFRNPYGNRFGGPASAAQQAIADGTIVNSEFPDGPPANQAFTTQGGGGKKYVDPRTDPSLGPQKTYRETLKSGFGFNRGGVDQGGLGQAPGPIDKNALLTSMQGTQDRLAGELDTAKEALPQGPNLAGIAGYAAQAGGALMNMFPGEAEVQTTPKVRLDRLSYKDTSERLRQQSKVDERVQASNARNVAGGNVQNYLANRRQAGVRNLVNQQNINSQEWMQANRVANQNAIIGGREAMFNSQLGLRDTEANAANRAARRQSIATGVGQLGQLGGMIGRDSRGQLNEDDLKKLLGNMNAYDIFGNFKKE